MKKIFTKGRYIVFVIAVFMGATLPAKAQFVEANVETGGLYTATAKDASGNLYVTRVSPATSGATYEIEKYTNATGTPAVIYTGLTHELGDYPWGLTVTSTGVVYVSTDFTSLGGAIIKLTPAGANYTATTYQTGRYFTALAVDAGDNLYVTEYDVVHSTYAVVEYPANSAANTPGANLYDNLKAGAGYAYPTGLAVNSTGDVYVADAFSNDLSITDGGHVYKLVKASAFAATTVSSGEYSSALALDAMGDLFSSENRGTGYQLYKYTSGTGTGTSVYSPMHTNGIYYPWGIAVVTNNKVFAIDGDDGTNGGILMQLSPPSPNAGLALLRVMGVTLSPVFAPATTNYTGSVANSVQSTTVTPTTSVSVSTVTVNGTAVASGTASGSIPLNVGPNTINTVVTAQDGVTTRTYTVVVTRAPSAVATLASLSLSNGGLSPSFVKTTTSYTSSVANGITSITVTPTTTDPTATVTVNGATVASGYASGAIALAVGPNTITTVVTAQDGVTQDTYTVTVTRAPSANANLALLRLPGIAISPTFVGSTTSYTASVANSVTSTTVVPTTSVNVSTVTVNGMTVASGTASGSIPLAPGAYTTINVVVTAQDGITTKTYTVMVARGPSTVATLANLTISSGTLSPAFATGTTSYTTSVANQPGSITVTPTTTDPGATIAINGVAVTSGTASGNINLNVGNDNTIDVVVTAQDGETTDTYALLVTRAPSAIATLANLTISSGTLAPVFATATNNYTASVANGVSTLNVTPTATDLTALIKVNNIAITSGNYLPVSLAVGQNTITVALTAQDGVTTDTYTIIVTRAPSVNDGLSLLRLPGIPLTPTFAVATTSYTASVLNSVSSTTVIPTTSVDVSTVTVNGVAVASGVASGSIPLNVGNNTITTIVTAQDGVTQRTYTVVVTRAASAVATLATLTPGAGSLNPAFDPATFGYTDAVDYFTTSITITPAVTDPTATVTVNGTAVTSGTASGAIALVVGTNTIKTVVTAQNGTKKDTYTITVTRALSPIATLSNLVSSNGTLSPAFASGTTNYTASVGPGISSMTVTPTTTDPNATVTVNGTAVTSGTASQALPLVTGSNNITTTVTAQDGNTVDVYTLVVTKAPSPNAGLGNLRLPGIPLSPTFVPATTSYTASVANSVSSTTVIPTTSVSVSTVKVNGVSVASGTASGSIALNVGDNTISTVVTAEDGVTTRTYTAVVTRAMGAANSLYLPTSVTNPVKAPLFDVDGLKVHEGISPNGDGINDFLVIDGITAYPDNKLTIMSRNGELVYEATGYDNSSRLFDGHSNKNGRMQQPGTYFYSLEYKVDGVTKHKTGFVVLKY